MGPLGLVAGDGTRCIGSSVSHQWTRSLAARFICVVVVGVVVVLLLTESRCLHKAGREREKYAQRDGTPWPGTTIHEALALPQEWGNAPIPRPDSGDTLGPLTPTARERLRRQLDAREDRRHLPDQQHAARMWNFLDALATEGGTARRRRPGLGCRTPATTCTTSGKTAPSAVAPTSSRAPAGGKPALAR